MSDSYQAIYDAVRSRISGGDIGNAVSEAINQQASGLSWAIEAIKAEFCAAADTQRIAALEAQRPSVLFRPTLSIDGDQWCTLYGNNLQDGVAGFGDTPEAAMLAFDRAWVNDKTPLAARGAQ